MIRRRKIGIALLACGLVVGLAWIAEKKSRPWRVPLYHVSLPAEFDVEEAEGLGKGHQTFRFSPRKVYLSYHQRGWDIARRDWIRGRNLSNYMVQAVDPANQALANGRQQFHRERW